MLGTENERTQLPAQARRTVLTFLPYEHAVAAPPDRDPGIGPRARSSRRHPGRGAPVPWTLSARIAERRARMREMGARLFAREGINGIAVLDVARAADAPVSPSAHGYRRRQDLVFDILYAYVDALHEYVGEADEAHEADPGEQRLVGLIEALLDGIHDHRDAHQLMMAALPTLAEDQRDLLRYQTRMMIHRLMPVLDVAVPGIAQRHDLRAPLLQSLLGMASHAPFWLKADGPLTRDAYAGLIAKAMVAAARDLAAEAR